MKNKAFPSKMGISKIFQKLPNKLVNFSTKFLPRLGNFRALVENFQYLFRSVDLSTSK